ncbi:SrpA-related protein [Candidatus Rhodobacter oscarellae]|uniref:SrpA-related protein n=1 Tax=Candidatus Rhodobacter oscarellae TaxID=1675527 RepID=A0A0J9E864_9RHOB|nr:putative metalloprotease CJM1_0395 family protein [Candidatus Rhodobacter lobularis]KMW57954.1 SrpA-related protein [Candidatus Rhodobacter lobularis]
MEQVDPTAAAAAPQASVYSIMSARFAERAARSAAASPAASPAASQDAPRAASQAALSASDRLGGTTELAPRGESSKASRNLLLARADASTRAEKSASNAAGLTEQEQQVVQKLKARDREVRAHEQAHAAVGGEYAGQPTYSYQTGPDGQQYAIGGEVAIDAAPVPGDPEATIQKMEVVKAAALAPAEPSGQDRKVAAQADAQRMAAIAELAALRAAARSDPEAAAQLEAR